MGALRRMSVEPVTEMSFASAAMQLRSAVDFESISPVDWTTVCYALELPVLLDAALRRKSSDVGKLNMALVRMADAVHDPDRYLREERQLHETIAKISANPLLVHLYMLLLDAAPTTLVPGNVERHLLVHQHLVDAIIDTSPELVRRAAKEHRHLLPR
jgi:DNA-binding FadR family transcriptional regulator